MVPAYLQTRQNHCGVLLVQFGRQPPSQPYSNIPMFFHNNISLGVSALCKNGFRVLGSSGELMKVFKSMLKSWLLQWLRVSWMLSPFQAVPPFKPKHYFITIWKSYIPTIYSICKTRTTIQEISPARWDGGCCGEFCWAFSAAIPSIMTVRHSQTCPLFRKGVAIKP